MSEESSAVIAGELSRVRRDCEARLAGCELVACVQALVQVKVTRGGCKRLTVNLRFHDDYPARGVILELKSKTLSDHFLQSLDKLCEQRIAEQWLGREHVMDTVAFISHFLDENPLSACFDEVQYIKNKVIDGSDTLKIKQKLGILDIKSRSGQYFMHFQVTVPDNYPNEAAGFVEKAGNFPTTLTKVFVGNVNEICRQCITPPLKKKPKDPPFEPKPSVRRVVEFLITDCIKRCHLEVCRLCEERALPLSPEDVIGNVNDAKHVERIYCGHLYHYGCLHAFMTQPPFQGGKKCLGCGKRIYHERWTPNVTLAEARWAHQQARERELEEVADFLK